jgi:hypothetical protein
VHRGPGAECPLSRRASPCSVQLCTVFVDVGRFGRSPTPSGISVAQVPVPRSAVE